MPGSSSASASRHTKNRFILRPPPEKWSSAIYHKQRTEATGKGAEKAAMDQEKKKHLTSLV
jgi:hypothetical protein